VKLTSYENFILHINKKVTVTKFTIIKYPLRNVPHPTKFLTLKAWRKRSSFHVSIVTRNSHFTM